MYGHIAKLAMLKIPEEQVEAFEKELSGIVAMVENLPEIPSAATLLEPGNVHGAARGCRCALVSAG